MDSGNIIRKNGDKNKGSVRISISRGVDENSMNCAHCLGPLGEPSWLWERRKEGDLWLCDRCHRCAACGVPFDQRMSAWTTARGETLLICPGCAARKAAMKVYSIEDLRAAATQNQACQ